MAKKLVTIDVEDKNLKASAGSVKAKTAKAAEKKEIENFGIVEINNASSAKKVKANTEKGFEKIVSGESKKSVKAKTSQVDDYFDFSFKTKAAKTAKVEEKKEEKVQETAVLKVSEEVKTAQCDNVASSVCFDNEANNVIRVARIGSLFGCDVRMINA